MNCDRRGCLGDSDNFCLVPPPDADVPAFITMMAGEAAWAFFEVIELTCPDPISQAVWYRLRTAGAVITILGLLAFVLRYTGCVQWVDRRRFALVCTPALALIIVAWTNPWHHLYWITHRPGLTGPFHIAVPVYGPAFWIHFGYCYVMVAVSTFLLAQAAVQSAGVYRARRPSCSSAWSCPGSSTLST